jgi:hypothetical protein
MHEEKYDELNILYKKTSVIFKLWVDLMFVFFVNINQLYEILRSMAEY